MSNKGCDFLCFELIYGSGFSIFLRQGVINFNKYQCAVSRWWMLFSLQSLKYSFACNNLILRMKWIRILCSIKWLLVKSRNNNNYYWLKNVIQIVTKLIYFFLLVHFVFPIQTMPTWYQLKSFLLSLHSSIFLYTEWVTWEFIDLDPLGQLQYMVLIGKINVSAKVAYHHTGRKKWWAPQLMKKWHLLHVQKWSCSVLIPAYIQSIIAITSTFTGSSLLL